MIDLTVGKCQLGERFVDATEHVPSSSRLGQSLQESNRGSAGGGMTSEDVMWVSGFGTWAEVWIRDSWRYHSRLRVGSLHIDIERSVEFPCNAIEVNMCYVVAKLR